MAEVGQSADARLHLRERVKGMFERAHRSGLIGQVTLRHAHIGGTENTLPRAGIRLGQHGYSCHTGKRAHRLHADAFKQSAIGFDGTSGDHFVISGDQCGLVQISAAFQRMTTQQSHHICAFADLFQQTMSQLQFLRSQRIDFFPVLSFFGKFHLYFSCSTAQAKVCTPLNLLLLFETPAKAR